MSNKQKEGPREKARCCIPVRKGVRFLARILEPLPPSVSPHTFQSETALERHLRLLPSVPVLGEYPMPENGNVISRRCPTRQSN